MTTLKKHFIDIYTMLRSRDAPRDGICSHFGYSFVSNNLTVQISEKRDGDFLLVSLSYDYYEFKKGKFGPATRSRRTFKKHAQSVIDAIEHVIGGSVNMVESWNGADGSSGISIVLLAPVPTSLLNAQRNYKKSSNVFNYDDFDTARSNRLQHFYDTHEPEWKEVEYAKLAAVASKHSKVNMAFENVAALKRLGLNDVADMMLTLLPNQVTDYV